MTVEHVIRRARSVADKGCKYKLGCGGLNPEAEFPWDKDGNCDCSAYIAWCVGVSKYVTGFPWYDEEHNGKWLNTDAIVRDARSPFGFMDLIATPRPGCLIVYPKLSAKGYGHIGLVTEGTTLDKCRVIHCSGGNYSKTGDAIRETDSSVFRKAETIFVWCAFVNNKM